MNEARFNPRAMAAREGQQQIRGLDIGEGFALIGTQLVPRIEGTELVISVLAIGGKVSPIAGLDPKPVPICDIARAPLASIRRALGGNAGSDAGVSAPSATESAEPDTSSLILGGPLRSVP